MNAILSNKLTQKIVDKMMSDISFNINMMNQEGIIIASGEQERIGVPHQGATKAIETGQTSVIYEDTLTEKKGINTPLMINGEVVGVVGISGEPQKVLQFEKVVNTLVTLLIEEEIENKNLLQRQRYLESFFLNLLLNESQITDSIVEKAKTFHWDLTRESCVLIIKSLTAEIKVNPFLPSESFQIIPADSTTTLVIMQDVAVSATEMAQQILTENPTVKIAISDKTISLSEGYTQARNTMKIAKRLLMPEAISHFSAYSFLNDLMQIDGLSSRQHSSMVILKENPELVQTLTIYLRENQEIVRTANELNIHRNTLKYRLQRIFQLTGKDPEKIVDLFELLYFLISERQ